MICFDYFVVAILGLSFGSFANVCIIRLPSDINIISPSRCQFCKTPIKYFDNIPIISYLILKGVSRCCNKKISMQYPVIVPTITPKLNINKPVEGSIAKIKNAASPIVAVSTATKDPNDIRP